MDPDSLMFDNAGPGAASTTNDVSDPPISTSVRSVEFPGSGEPAQGLPTSTGGRVQQSAHSSGKAPAHSASRQVVLEELRDENSVLKQRLQSVKDAASDALGELEEAK